MSAIEKLQALSAAIWAYAAARKEERAAVDAVVACAESAPEFSSPPEMVELADIAQQKVEAAEEALRALGRAAEELYK